MPDYLKISDVAKLMRTTPDAIRFYEKNNIIKPERCSDNRYRNFIMNDIRSLYDCKMLQNIQFSISDITKIIRDTSEEEFDEMIDKREEEIKKSIELHQMALEKIARIKKACDKIKHYSNEFLVQDRPHVLIYNYAKNNKIDINSLNHPYYQAVMDYHNLFDCSVVIPFENIEDVEFQNYSGFGFCINVDIARHYGIPNNMPVKELIPCKCVYTIVEAHTVINNISLNPMYDWIKRHNFVVNGDVLCSVIKISYDKGEPHRFYEVWCPIN